MSTLPCLALLLLTLAQGSLSAPDNSPDKVISVTFLLTVNDTWYPEEYNNKLCIKTVKTPPLKPNQKWNESENILVGDCDHGPLLYTVSDEGNGKSSITVTFYSSVIEDASHPSCTIQWNYSYLVPTSESWNADQSLLPGCFNAESREGYHMTYYWFHVLDWMMG